MCLYKISKPFFMIPHSESSILYVGFIQTIVNLVKKIVGLNIFQSSVFMFYISMGKVSGGTAPILTDNPHEVYSNPLPHVLILTAIVVGISTTALALALTVRIREAYGTIEEDDILELDRDTERKREASEDEAAN